MIARLKRIAKWIKEIPKGELNWVNLIINFITFVIASGGLYQACQSTNIASRAAAEPSFDITFRQTTVKRFTVLNQPNSFAVYPLTKAPGYKDPPDTQANDILISNEGEVWAQNVRIRLRLKEPFIFVNVYFDEELQGKWRVVPDVNTYRFVELVRLEAIDPKPKGRIKISFAYTIPTNLKKPAEEEHPDALEIMVTSDRMNKTGAAKRTWPLKYPG